MGSLARIVPRAQANACEGRFVMLGAIVAVEGTATIAAAHIEHLTMILSPLVDEVLLLGGTEAGSRHREVRVPRGMSELGAIAKVLSQTDEHAMVVAADLRRPSAELMRYMAMIRAGHEAVVPEGPGGQLQPMLAIYHARVTGRARGLVSSGEREPRALLENVLVRRVSVDELTKFGSPRRLLQRGPV